MTRIVAKIAQIAEGHLLLANTIREGRQLYAPGALTLVNNVTPVLVNHDPDRVIGRVIALDTWDDTNGRWVFARCELTETPEWLRGGAYNGSGASMCWVDTGTSQQLPGGWTRFNRGLITEVSVLSPSVRPAETLAKVVTLQRAQWTAPVSSTLETAERDSDVVLHNDGRSLIRYFQTPIVVR